MCIENGTPSARLLIEFGVCVLVLRINFILIIFTLLIQKHTSTESFSSFSKSFYFPDQSTYESKLPIKIKIYLKIFFCNTKEIVLEVVILNTEYRRAYIYVYNLL